MNLPSNDQRMFCLPHEKRSSLKGRKEFALIESKFFPFQNRPISEGVWPAVQKSGP